VNGITLAAILADDEQKSRRFFSPFQRYMCCLLFLLFGKEFRRNQLTTLPGKMENK
jgi:hypothetical protein